MRSTKALRDAGPDPKLGKSKARSNVEFPYYDLDTSVEVAKTIHERAGGICDRSQLAAYLNYSSPTNGSFLTRVAAAKMYGVIEQAASGLQVSDRGRAIIAPVTASGRAFALVEAFLAVELFEKVYNQFKGTTLPEQTGLRNLLASQFGVVKARVAPTVRIMLDSAEQAGLFSVAGRTRMVMPNLGALQRSTSPEPDPVPELPRPVLRSAAFYGGGDDGIDPAFMGLLRSLPPKEQPLSAKRRKAIADAFTNIVNMVYPEDDE